MNDLPMVRAMDGSLIGWETGPPSRWSLLRQLARIPRFAGATLVPWNVLQHSLHVARLLEADGFSLGIQAAGLLHDAAEILTGDVPSPFKPPEWKALEEAWIERATTQFGLRINWAAAWGPVHEADAMALHNEAHLLMPAGEWEPSLDYLERLRGVLLMDDTDVLLTAEGMLFQGELRAETEEAKDDG